MQRVRNWPDLLENTSSLSVRVSRRAHDRHSHLSEGEAETFYCAITSKRHAS
jgi:hypothetical protein